MPACWPICLGFAITLCLGGPAAAHPHVFVEAKTEIVFDTGGRIVAVRNIWRFDEAFSAFAIQGLDNKGDGKLTKAELKPLADVNIKSLKQFEFFTYLTDGQEEAKFLPATAYWLEYHNGQLTLIYTLPLKNPSALGPTTTLEIFDPGYFVAFEFSKDHPVKLDHAPRGCTAVLPHPRDLDAQTMAALAAIPIEQHDLPPDLVKAAAALANHVTISCPLVPGSRASAVAAAGPPAADASAAISELLEHVEKTAVPPRASNDPSASSVKETNVDSGLGGTKAAKEETAAVATHSVAPIATGDPSQPPSARTEPPSSAGVAGNSINPAAGLSGNVMALLGLVLFLAAAGGGVLSLFLRRRPSRSR